MAWKDIETKALAYLKQLSQPVFSDVLDFALEWRHGTFPRNWEDFGLVGITFAGSLSAPGQLRLPPLMAQLRKGSPEKATADVRRDFERLHGIIDVQEFCSFSHAQSTVLRNGLRKIPDVTKLVSIGSIGGHDRYERMLSMGTLKSGGEALVVQPL